MAQTEQGASELSSYLAIDGVRARYDVKSRATIWRWVKEGILPEPYKFGGVRRWRLDELIERENRVEEGA